MWYFTKSRTKKCSILKIAVMFLQIGEKQNMTKNDTVWMERRHFRFKKRWKISYFNVINVE